MAKTLFDPVRIGSLTLKNRLMRSATWEGMCDDSGAVTQQLIDCYRELAAGGVGLIVSGYSFVRADGKQLPGKMGLHDDAMLAGLGRLCDAVHQQGGHLFCQLVHAGGQTSSKVIGKQPLAPSAVEFPSFSETPRAMTSAEIDAVVEAFATAAARAKAAGFDGVQLHGAHGYLVNQFLSPLTNRRDDAYGGSLENRMRFLLRIVVAVRSSVGGGFPVTIKLTASDNLDGGFSVDEAVSVAAEIVAAGIDAIEVSAGTPASAERGPVRQNILSPQQEAYNAAPARRIKEAVEVPVALVGGLRSGDLLTRLLRQSVADQFAFSRPLIRQPDLPRLLREDDGYVATCTSCNGCFRPGLKGDGIYCVLDRIEEKKP
jgi:2,4-dienoyl-CoA reductase-like NADH-dependent reductase (Old Yellow Enzyme family)